MARASKQRPAVWRVSSGVSNRPHMAPEDRKHLLTKGWFNRIRNLYYHGKTPYCNVCKGELKVGDRISRSHGRNYYHEKCWEGLFH